MPIAATDLEVVIQVLDNGCFLAEGLLYPEVSRFGDSLRFVRSGISQSAEHLLQQLPPTEIHRRLPTGSLDIDEVAVEVEPPPRSESFRRPLKLTLPLVHWDHGDAAHLAYLPSLELEVHGSDWEDVRERLPREVLAALFRTKASSSLERLCELQRCEELQTRSVPLPVHFPTPREREQELHRTPKAETALPQVADTLSWKNLTPAFELDEVVERLGESLTGPRPTSILLVGPSGVGKTAAFLELVRRKREFQLHTRPFWSSSGSRLVAGMTGFGMWQERCENLCRECREASVILHLGNLIELMEVGKSEHNAQGIASFLRPFIQRGDLLCVVECTEEQLRLIEEREPHLLRAFHQVPVQPPDRKRGRDILRRSARGWSERREGSVTEEALEHLDRLHRRYSPYSAYPGKPLRFLRHLIEMARIGDEVGVHQVISAFIDETGLPRFMVDDEVPLDLEETSRWFGSRVLGQSHAVGKLVDLLAAIKAGLGRPRKPLASLLLIGPTGVGKTELAKMLARFLFSSEERITRFDMSEYSDSVAVRRLTGGLEKREGQLTAKVRERPFSVVLFDEVEKAHPLFFDLLLQVLGEGRLTDAAGRVADFSSAVVLMTSNLGAESFQRQPVGFDAGDAKKEALKQVLRSVRDFFRPELVGRIDRVVPFSPLDEGTLRQIARRQLDQISKRDGVRYRGLDVSWDDRVVSYLAIKGHDPRYGARPLRRVIERELLAPLATALNRRTWDTQPDVVFRVEDARLAIEVSKSQRSSAKGRSGGLQPASRSELEQVVGASDLRRRAQHVRRGAVVRDISNEIFRLRKLQDRVERRRARGRHVAAHHLIELERLSALEDVKDLIEDVWAEICEVENDSLLGFYGHTETDDTEGRRPITPRVEELSERWDETLLEIYRLEFHQPDKITLAVFAEKHSALQLLTDAYRDVFAAEKLEVSTWRWALVRDPKSGEKVVSGERLTAKESKKADPLEGALGIAFELQGRAVFPRYRLEAGLHQLYRRGKRLDCLVDCSEALGGAYRPPVGIERRRALRAHELRRTYSIGDGELVDKQLNRRISFSRGRRLEGALAEAIDLSLRAVIARRFLES